LLLTELLARDEFEGSRRDKNLAALASTAWPIAAGTGVLGDESEVETD
jgi:hypothetical protein